MVAGNKPSRVYWKNDKMALPASEEHKTSFTKLYHQHTALKALGFIRFDTKGSLESLGYFVQLLIFVNFFHLDSQFHNNDESTQC